MSKKSNIIDLLEIHPDLNDTAIAEKAGATQSYVTYLRRTIEGTITQREPSPIPEQFSERFEDELYLSFQQQKDTNQIAKETLIPEARLLNAINASRDRQGAA